MIVTDPLPSQSIQERDVSIGVGPTTLEGTLSLPSAPVGIVVFAHGSGSSRHSPRNRLVARMLQDAGFATLLFDLLTVEEEAIDSQTGHLRFNIVFLAERLVAALEWVEEQDAIRSLAIGLFGASTGAAAALMAAALHPSIIHAVVSRGGRPDLAGAAIEQVQAPTLLIVGGQDEVVLQLNQEALTKLHCEKRLEVVPGATHLFEEPGTLEEASALARSWFERHLVAAFGGGQ
jgi:putative phosphoribosyl transferase